MFEIARVMISPSLVTIHAFDDAPSVTKPSGATSHASSAPRTLASVFASACASNPTDLMSRRAQRMSGTLTMRVPLRADGVSISARGSANMKIVRRGVSGATKSRAPYAPRVTCR